MTRFSVFSCNHAVHLNRCLPWCSACHFNVEESTYFVFLVFRVCGRTIGSDPLARKAAWDNTAGGVLLTLFFFYIITSTLVSVELRVSSLKPNIITSLPPPVPLLPPRDCEDFSLLWMRSIFTAGGVIRTRTKTCIVSMWPYVWSLAINTSGPAGVLTGCYYSIDSFVCWVLICSVPSVMVVLAPQPEYHRAIPVDFFVLV